MIGTRRGCSRAANSIRAYWRDIVTKKIMTAVVASALGIMLLAGSSALAQKAPADADRVAAARELMEASGSTRQFEAVMPMILAQMQGLFVKMKPGNEKDIAEVFAAIGKRFLDRKGEVFDEIAALYAEKLTAQELREIAAFFRTGVGAKFVTLQPELVQKSMVIGQRWGERIGRDVEADVRKELKKRGVDL